MCVSVSVRGLREKAAVFVFSLWVLFLLPDRTGVKTEIQSGLLLLLVSQFLHVLVVLVVGIQQLVPPGEGGGVVPDEVHVVEVVEAGAGVERDQVERVPGDVVTTGREQGRKIKSVRYLFNKNNPFF